MTANPHGGTQPSTSDGSALDAGMSRGDGVVQVLKIGSVGELIEKLRPATSLWPGVLQQSWVFRGQGDASWRLVPRAYRSEARDHFRFRTDQKTQPFNEFMLLVTFVRLADQNGLFIPNTEWLHDRLEARNFNLRNAGTRWPDPHDLPGLALAQHHGAPTRLLDWSRWPLAAAYFAAAQGMKLLRAGHSDGALAVWALNTAYVEEAWNLPVEHGPRPFEITTVAAAPNRNLRAQSGVFTVHRDIGQNLAHDEVISTALAGRGEDGADPNDAIRRLELPRSLAPDLLHRLRLENVTAATMFPGFSGVVDAVREEASFWKALTTGETDH